MKQFFSLIALTLLACSLSTAKEKIVAGYFQGENLFVINPLQYDEGEEPTFCIQKVQVNGKPAKANLNSSSFELDLSVFNIKRGDSITIVFEHKEECEPKILNEEDLQPISTFVITSINVDNTSTLHWSTIEEQGRLPFTVEQYRWGKWIELGRTEGFGSPVPHDYAFDLKANGEILPHSGKNRYRVKQTDYRGTVRYSLETNYSPLGVEEVSILDDKGEPFDGKKIKSEIVFSGKTSYQLINLSGVVLSQGYEDKVSLVSLPGGKYFINYDSNTMHKIKLSK